MAPGAALSLRELLALLGSRGSHKIHWVPYVHSEPQLNLSLCPVVTTLQAWIPRKLINGVLTCESPSYIFFPRNMNIDTSPFPISLSFRLMSFKSLFMAFQGGFKREQRSFTYLICQGWAKDPPCISQCLKNEWCSSVPLFRCSKRRPGKKQQQRNNVPPNP